MARAASVPMVVTEMQCMALYLALGQARSLVALYERLKSEHGAEAVPALGTLTAWCGANGWVVKAEAHDAKVSAALAEKVAAAQLKREWSAVDALTEAAQILLEAATLATAAKAAAGKGDAAGMVRAATEALKLREVMTGGVSDRTASQVDEAVATREAARVLRQLELRILRGPGKTLDVAEDGTATPTESV